MKGIAPRVQLMGNRLIRVFDGGGKLFVAGNGGSAADAKDAFLGISSSGKALNVLYTMIAARAKGLYTIAFTGREPSPIGEIAETVICVPAADISEVQQMHEVIYHALCKLLEAHYFK